MKDLEIVLKNKIGSLALVGETLGQNKISLEGGGVFVNGDHSNQLVIVADNYEKAKKVSEEWMKDWW